MHSEIPLERGVVPSVIGSALYYQFALREFFLLENCRDACDRLDFACWHENPHVRPDAAAVEVLNPSSLLPSPKTIATSISWKIVAETSESGATTLASEL